VFTCLSIFALPVSHGAAERNHPVNTLIKAKDIETKGDVTIGAGISRDSRLGEGAVILRTRSAGGTTLALRFRAFYGSGSQRGVGTVNITPNPDGTVSFSGTARYTGGTGRFRGISGNLRIRSGDLAADGTLTARVTGNAKY
jgi:hypothetical protein